MGIAFMNIYEHHEHAWGVLAPKKEKVCFFIFSSVFGCVSCSFCFIMFINSVMRSVSGTFRYMEAVFYEHYEDL